MSRIQINNNAILSYIAWHGGKPFIAVLVLWCSGARCTSSSAGLVLGERLMYNGCGHARASLWHGHVPGSAVLSVPDIPLTDKKQ